MMKKVLYFLPVLIISIIFSACNEVSYEPSGTPTYDDGITSFFPDSVDGFQWETHFDLYEDEDCEYKILTSDYGNNDEISYTITYCQFSDCAKNYLEKEISQLKNQGFDVEKKKKVFLAETDTVKILVWTEEEWFFSIKAKTDYFDDATDNFYFISVKR